MMQAAGLVVVLVVAAIWWNVAIYERGYQAGYRRGSGKDRRWWS